MRFNYAKLKGRIIEKYGTQEDFAKAIGLTPTTFSFKINGKSSWKNDEIAKAAELLEISPNEIVEFFLTTKFKSLNFIIKIMKGTKMKTLKKAFEKIKDVIDDWLWSYTGLMISCTFLAIVGSILGSIVGVGVFLIIKLLLHKLFGLPFTVD